MLIKSDRWLLVVALFVLAPIAGMMTGVFGGLFLVDRVHEAAEEAPAIESDRTTALGEQSEAPQVVLPGGEEVELGELAPGRLTAVVVMKDVDCPVCQRQLRVLSNRLDEVKRRGGAVVGLSDAGECQNRRLMQRHRLNFPIVSDADHQVLQEFDMTLPDRSHVMPGIIFLDEDGEVEHIHQGRAPGQNQERLVLQWLHNR